MSMRPQTLSRPLEPDQLLRNQVGISALNVFPLTIQKDKLLVKANASFHIRVDLYSFLCCGVTIAKCSLLDIFCSR